MSNTFTRDDSNTFTRDDGTKWREVGRTFPNDNVIIEPIPAPPQTEAEIIEELAAALKHEVRGAIVLWNAEGAARAIVAACKKLRGLEGK